MTPELAIMLEVAISFFLMISLGLFFYILLTDSDSGEDDYEDNYDDH